jgi:hypothetical protein
MDGPTPHSRVFVRDVGDQIGDRRSVEVVVEDDAAPHPDCGIRI